MPSPGAERRSALGPRGGQGRPPGPSGPSEGGGAACDGGTHVDGGLRPDSHPIRGGADGGGPVRADGPRTGPVAREGSRPRGDEVWGNGASQARTAQGSNTIPTRNVRTSTRRLVAQSVASRRAWVRRSSSVTGLTGPPFVLGGIRELWMTVRTVDGNRETLSNPVISARPRAGRTGSLGTVA